MVEFWEYKQRINKFYRFSNKEIKGLFISIVVLAFIWAYEGINQFNFIKFFGDYIIAFIMVGIALFIHVSAQKIMGIKYGFYIEYKIWINGLIGGLIVALLTNGYFPLLIPGGITINYLSRLRIGEFRFGQNLVETTLAVVAGPYANFIFAMFVKFIVWQILGIDSSIVDEFFKLNMILAVYMLLPINPLPGVIAMIGSKFYYVFLFAAFLGYLILIVILGFYSLIWGLIIGAIIFGVYYWNIER